MRKINASTPCARRSIALKIRRLPLTTTTRKKRAIANAITLEFTDGTRFEEVVVEYPIGHARRRHDGIPKLVDKFKINLARQFPTRQQQRILEVSLDRTRLEQMPVNEYLDLYVI